MPDSLQKVRRLIERAHLGWLAAETPISQLYSDGKMRQFGFAQLANEPSGGRLELTRRQTFAFSAAHPPSMVNWKNVRGRSYVSDVRDQGTCAACVAFSVCAALESRAKIQKKDPYLDIELSKAHLFYCGNQSQSACEEGWHPALALNFCKKTGVGRERDFPFQSAREKCREIPPALKVPRWKRILNHYEEGRAAIRLRGPVVAGVVVYRDFLYYRGGVYRPVLSESLGFHALAVIGFDDANSCWLVKNSWGHDWGEGGFAQIGYGCCGIDAQFPFYDAEIALLNT